MSTKPVHIRNISAADYFYFKEENMMEIEKISVLGAGNGGQAVAANLSLTGFEVNLYSRSKERIDPVLRRGGIELTGEGQKGFAKLKKVTTNIYEAIRGTDLIVVVVPAFAHKGIAEICAPLLENGQIVVLNPGSGGTLEFAKTMREMSLEKDVMIAETNTLTYGCRIIGPSQVRILVVAKEILFATFPGKNTEKAISRVKGVFPSIRPAANVLETCLTNLNAVCHPAQMLLNVGPIERLDGDFLIYSEGTTPSVARVIGEVDKERLSIMKALDLEPVPFEELEFRAGYIPEKGTIYEIMNSDAIRLVKAPDLRSRYITEDVPYGLVPMASIADMLKIPSPIIHSFIEIASAINQTNYWKEGRTIEKMGISQLVSPALNKFLRDGYQ